MKVFLEEVTRKMDESYQIFLRDLNGLRTGRANSSLLDGVAVNVHGGHKVRLNQVGSVSLLNNQMLSVTVWEQANVAAVNNAILSSELGLTPIVEGKVLRIPLPALTTERRQELIKVAKKYSERAKISLRNIKRDTVKEVKDNKDRFSEDERHDLENKLQKILEEVEKKVEDTLLKKEKEIVSF